MQDTFALYIGHICQINLLTQLASQRGDENNADP